MSFSTKECAWAQTKLKALGRTFVGIEAFEFSKSVSKEAMFGAGDEPIDIQTGNKEYKGSVTLRKYEVDALNDAAQAAGYEDITEVPHEAIVITCSYKKNVTDQQRTITSLATAFTEMTVGMKQNDKQTSVQLSFISMKITHTNS